MKVAILGCGLIGQKRARAVGAQSVIACADTNRARAVALAARQQSDCVATSDPVEAACHPAVDVVIVATTHDSLAELTRLALDAGKHVLVEKPAARSTAELLPVLEKAEATDRLVKVGFNHRFHPALARAHDLFKQGAIGELMYMRARYGHGGRLGYEREWRADRRISGGGELLDQGSHLIDLARWFAGDFVDVFGHLGTYFWPMQVEDNAFAMLRTRAGQVAWLHTSWTEWKNLFSFEVFGRTGKLQVDGLGGSYGTERLTYYRMLPELGPPETKSWEFPGEDESWQLEFQHFVDCIHNGLPMRGSLPDAMAMLRVVESLYDQAAA